MLREHLRLHLSGRVTAWPELSAKRRHRTNNNDARGARRADDHRLFSPMFARDIFRVVLFIYLDFGFPHTEYAMDTLGNHTGVVVGAAT